MIDISAFFSAVWPYLVAILVFLILIVIHEFGHFIAAKLMGVRVNAFAVGFGPKLLRKKWGETEYSLNLIPFGGYCEMEGEDEESTDARAFCKQKAWKRLIIIVAGAAMNLIFGLIIVAIMLAPQENFSSTKIAKFQEGATSAQYGLEVGDEIIGVDGRKIYSTFDLSYAFTGIADGKVDLTVLRDGEKKTLEDVQFETETVEGMELIKVDFWVQAEPKTFGNYVSQTFNTAISYGRVVWLSLIDLIGGRFGISAMAGPVGVTAAIGSVAKSSLLDLLPMVALISINLGIFNLLPIPALDGGRVFFILVEMIFRRPVPPDKERLVHGIGLAILFGFMIFITIKDIWALIAG